MAKIEKKMGSEKQLIGEVMVESKLITPKQLEQALKRQAQNGGYLGSILIEMDFISIENFLSFLSKYFGVPSANLFKHDIDQKVIRLLPLAKIKSLNILPIACDQKTITLAMVNPLDFMTISEVEFTLGMKVKPVVVPYFMMEAATKGLKSVAGERLSGKAISMIAEASKEKMEAMPEIISLLRYLAKSSASDMLLTAGAPPSVKINNDLKRLAMPPLTPFDCEKYARELLPEKEWVLFEQKNDFNLAVTYPDIGRFRLNIFRQRNSVSIACRFIPEKIPSLAELHLPDWIETFALRPQGLILITGPAGHGKSTTLSAMVDIINTNKRCNILTLEDPVEALHKHKKSNVNQREIGRDVESFYEGLKNIFRQAADVVVIGEMRDKESFEIALKAANTGSLVISTVHSDNSTSILDRFISMFPPNQQNIIRMILANTLLLSISQRLVPIKKGHGRILALEKTINSFRIKNLIREEKTHQIRSQLQAGAEDYTSMDVSLATLCNTGSINFEDGLVFVEDESYYRELTHKPKK